MSERPAGGAGHDDAGGEVLWQDGERSFCRISRRLDGGTRQLCVAVVPGGDLPPAAMVRRLRHEFELREHLDGAWALRPLELLPDGGRAILVLEDHGGEPLERLLGVPMELGRFLDLAIAITEALGHLHRRGLVHKDMKPGNVFVDAADRVRLTGFGIASRLPRERQAPEPPEVIAGTLAYMAPEQTGRMNRSIDTRSDLYSLGVTFYQMLTGVLPFSASDPMGWVHCHIAKRPVPPAERAWMPAVVSQIVLKLLVKTAEDRYQTAAGVAADLKRCRALLEATGAVAAFPLGAQDVPDVLRIPEKLYGREAEVSTLLAAFDRVIAHGSPELVLVRGYSGVGKSSVVNELHKAIVPRRGLFAAGKFEQYRRDVPYATIAQAFRTLMRQLLARSETELAHWRQSLAEALGGLGELMVRIIPELELLIGAQPTVPELPPQDAQARFQRVFRRLVGVFARPEHPLVLFLDDLQWLDAATLTLLADLATHPEVHDLLLVGAYRDNEVGASHPLIRSLEAIRGGGAAVGEIVLAPLSLDDVGALIADVLHCDTEHARQLTRLVHEKTGGNPFFTIQFLSALGEEKLLSYDADTVSWVADLGRIHGKGYTDNVVDLMVGKLARLPGETREELKQLACLGSLARFGTLERVSGQSADAVHASLWHAVRDGLLLRTGEGYAFVHDRVQEAAYSLVPPEDRPALHLRLARALLRDMHPDEVIDVADQFNRGAALLVDPRERERIAELDLLAGRKAKSSAAYASAATYFAAGMRLLADDAWSRRYALAFELWLERAECEHLGGNFAAAEPIITELLARCTSKADKAAAYRLKIDLHVMKGENARAIEGAVACLELLGIEISAHPTRQQVEAELEKVWRNLADRPIESLADLPPMTDPEKQAAMLVLSVIYAPAYFTDRNLLHLHMCLMVNLTLEHGTSEASAAGYACFGVTVGPNYGRYADGYRFCKLACDMVERPELAGYKPKVYVSTEMAFLWTQPVAVALDYVQAAQRAAIEAGDPAIGCYAATHIVTDRLLRGDHLDDVLRESERGVEFARKANFRDIVDVIRAQQQFVQNMRGRTAGFSTFDSPGFDESVFEADLTPDRMATMMCFYWLLKLQARFLSGDLDAALEASARAQALLWSADGHIQLVDYHFYTALTLAAACRGAPPQSQRQASAALAAHLAQLARWVDHGAMSFRDRHALLQAEAARVEGRELDAQRLYEQAIRLAREERYLHNEALASELAGRYWTDRGFGEIGALYLRKARGCYARWGAAGKVRQLDEAHPALEEGEAAAPATGTIGAPVEHLDLATVLKVSQAVSGEIVLEKMLETLMLAAIEHAGAERGLLTLAVSGEQRVAAEATTTGDRVAVQLRDQPLAEAAVPQSVFLYLLRTQEAVVLDDAAAQGPFAGDPYIVERRTRSVLCLPLLKQGRVMGVLYLENNLAARAFVPGRLATLKLLASEAAISLENSRLYRDLAVREARIRRLVDANIIGIFIWDTGGRILDANDAFLRMVGYERGDLASRGLRWTELTPAEWRDQDDQHVPQLRVAGSLQPYEKEYFRKDGSRVPVLIGAAMYEEAGDEGVAFVLDLTERKRSEQEARRSERRLHEMQMRLVDANRIATAGHLSAAIAHELNQPLAGMVANASTCLRRLGADPPNIEGASETAKRMIRDANRASDVIQRLRALFANKDTPAEWVDLNEAAQEVVALSSAALQKDRVSVQYDLAEDLPPIRGDRVQLQQVIMNLLRNAGDAMRDIDEHSRRVAIRTRRDEGDAVRLTVQDAGVGLDAGSAERLFEAFYTTKSAGMGIGLSVSRSIIERHHGRLWAEPNEGPGASFSFSIPREPAAPAPGTD